jgi:hypothetical protein
VQKGYRDFFLLAIILLVAASLRFYGLAWDGGYLFHPDERKILLVASELRLPASIGEFFSADSPLNPKFFAYGSFPIYLLKASSIFAPPIALNVPWREDFVGLAMLGRVLSVLFDLGTITMTFLLARRLYNATVGLMASACIAVTVLHIQLAHFYAVDTLLTFFVVATMYFAARYAQSNWGRDALLVGVSFGFALATKITAVPLVIPIAMAVLRQRGGEGEQGRGGEKKHLPLSRSPILLFKRWRDSIWQVRYPLARILAVALVVFLVTQPYALFDPVRYLGAVGTELLVARGWLDYPYTRQYADTLPFIYPIAQSSVWGMSLPLGIFAWGGSALVVWRWFQKRDWCDGFILAWALVYFLTTSGQHAKYLRYLLPLLPFLFMAASSFKSRLLRFAFFVSLFLAFIYSIAFVAMYSREHPWLTISRWIYTNIPAQATLAIEHWDDALPVPMRDADGDRAPTEYRARVLPLYDADDAAKLDAIVDALAASDYVILATHRLSSTITHLPQRYPMSSRYYRLLFDGTLGFELAMHAVNGIALDGIVIVDDRFELLQSDAVVWNWGRADESFTVYDHPMPLVFKKTRTLSRDELIGLLSQP